MPRTGYPIVRVCYPDDEPIVEALLEDFENWDGYHECHHATTNVGAQEYMHERAIELLRRAVALLVPHQDERPMQRFYITFGVGYDLRNNYQVVEAADETEARRIAAGVLPRTPSGAALYAFMYDEARFAGQPEKYGLTEVPLGTTPHGRD